MALALSGLGGFPSSFHIYYIRVLSACQEVFENFFLEIFVCSRLGSLPLTLLIIAEFSLNVNY
jgi:hypothetical protein